MRPRLDHMMRRAAFWPLTALGAVVALAIGLRLYVLLTPIGRLDGDEGTTAVMAQQVLDGVFPAFFGRQNYQGALEQYMQAATLLVLPDNPFVLRLSQVLLIAIALVLTYVVAHLVTSSRWAGVLAAALLAAGPYYFVFKGVKSHGGYDGAMVASLTMVVIALIIRRSIQSPGWLWGAAGLAGGVALWENPTALYVVAPTVLWISGLARGAIVRRGTWLAAGFIAGLLPVFAHMLRTGEVIPARTADQPATTFLWRLRQLFETVLPDFLGVASANWVVNPGLPARAFTACAVAALVFASWHRRSGLWCLLSLRSNRAKGIDLILLVLLASPLLYAASPFTWFTGEPRYLFLIYPIAAVAVAAGVAVLPVREFQVAAGVTAVMATAFLGITALGVAARADGALAIVRTGPAYSEDLPAVATELRRQGVTTAYANYWVAGPLQFASGNRVVVAAGLWTQFRGQEKVVRASRNPAVVVPTNPGAGQVREALLRTGRTFRQTQAGRFTIFTRINPPWHPAEGSFVLYAA